jgi:hypothetical protein
MASKIVPTNIDGTFPVAGQDNSSQGFRDNFTNIKNNFTFARNEIGDLQDKVLLKSALTGTTLSNDLGGTQLTNAQLKSWTQSIVNLGAIDGDATISFESGNFQKLTTAGPVELALNPFPAVSAGTYGLIRVWIYVTDVAHTVTLSSSISIGEGDIAGFDSATRTITFDSVGDYIFDFSSIDSGVNFLITDVNRNRSTQPGGIVITGYQYSQPLTNFTANINLNISRYIMDPTAPITNGNLRLPAVILDGTVIAISSTETITNLSVWGGETTTVKPSANVTLAAGTSIEYFYRASETTWYKVR